VTFVEGGITLPELEVTSYSWGAANPAGTTPSLRDLTLTLPASTRADVVEPGLWGHLAAGSHLDSATIHVRTRVGPPSAPVTPEYITYTLTNVFISSFTTAEDYSGGVPQDTFQLHFGQVKEEYFSINPDGTQGRLLNTAVYDRATGRGDRGSLEGPPLPAPPAVGLTFVEHGITLPELAVSGYSWGAANPTGTTPSLQDLALTLTPGLAADAVEPGLWGHLAAGIHLDSAAIHVRMITPGHTVEYITYTLTDVYISSFTTAQDDSSNNAPQDTIQLHFGEVKEEYSELNADGIRGFTNTADYNQKTGQGLPGQLAGGGHHGTPKPPVGVTFEDGALTIPDVPVTSYSWGAANPTGTLPRLQDLTLTVFPGADIGEPGLWGHLANLGRLSFHRTATINVYTTVAGVARVYLSYTLTNLVISSFTTAEDGSGARPQDTIKLQFAEVTESYTPINPDGTSGTSNTANYNQAWGFSGGAGSLAGPALPGGPPVGLTFVEGGATLPELEVSGYSWGAANPAGTTPSLQDLTLTLAAGSTTRGGVEPGLWGHLAARKHLDSATIHVRKFGQPGGLVEYITYTLTDVYISSFTTAEDGSGAVPQDTIQLHFGRVRESFEGNTAIYDRATGRGDPGGLEGPALPTPPALGLNFVGVGATPNELAVQSYSWGAANPAGNTPSLQDLTLTLTPGLDADAVEPGLWGHLAAGIHLDSAAIHVRRTTTPGHTVEYITYTLTDVYISSFTTAKADDSPVVAPEDTIHLHFGEVKESFTDSLGSTNTADYNQATGKSGGAGSLAKGGATGKPRIGLSFVEGGITLPELEVASYSWGAANPTGTTPSLQDLTLTTVGGVEPGLWGHLAAGIHLDSATIHVRMITPGHTVEYITYTLKDVYISSFTTTEDGSGAVPQDTIQLHFAEVKEDYFPIDLVTGSRGKPNTADYNQKTGQSGGAGNL
jgi:type VI protein secretion system component Hcp